MEVLPLALRFFEEERILAEWRVRVDPHTSEQRHPRSNHVCDGSYVLRGYG